MNICFLLSKVCMFRCLHVYMQQYYTTLKGFLKKLFLQSSFDFQDRDHKGNN